MTSGRITGTFALLAALLLAGCGSDGPSTAAAPDSNSDPLLELSEAMETPVAQQDPLGCSSVPESEVVEIFPELTGRRYVFDVEGESTCEWYDSASGLTTVGLRVYTDPAQCIDRYSTPTIAGQDERVTLTRHSLGVIGWGTVENAAGQLVCLLAADNVEGGDVSRVETVFAVLAGAIDPTS